MSSSVIDMQLFFMGLHEKNNIFSCKNTDQLSSLWAAFTKCKRNLRDGFRLENMSWRLWYREVMIRKRLDTETAIILSSSTEQQQPYTNIDNDYTNGSTLTRTRSLPSFSQQHDIIDTCKVTSPKSLPEPPTSTSTCMIKRSKFYIDHEDDEVSSLYDDDMDSSCYSSSVSSDPSLEEEQDNDTFVNGKKNSLLSNLLQQKETSQSNGGGLRRCHCYNRLDQWFNEALSS
ncbi:uncharacterized protein BX664DRAFT_329493 [Halteromyces radiatus]|uniref:uncharacterized protein n=1 Tax=Halteromyces radiatus TaxID=101107 RepID=UPI00221FBD54|nr:uncharacterized protein BX664DRAFT_329493 [Halteromyces radiatus]KAI8093350.1 hypothetical protein BX664DRAFT_329493 [Halteromyces radiatus]